MSWNIFKQKAAPPLQEVGLAGVKISNGYVFDEFLPQLQGEKGRKVFREMRDNDDTVSSIVFAIEMVLRAVEWRVDENEVYRGTAESLAQKEFLKSVLFDDMSHTWDDFISEVLTMLTYGWEYTEIVYKRRMGPDHPDSRFRSNYSDGKIGLRKLANRAQETLDRWEVDDTGGINGMWQSPPLGGASRYIPIEKALLFRPHPMKGSPEGRSVLRGAYRSWYFLKRLQDIEAIAIERELNGLPVVYIPNEILQGLSADAVKARTAYEKLVRDIKFNEQGGVVLPSNPYYDAEGKPTSVKQVELKLLSSEGSRSIDPSVAITRYQQGIARTVLADFIMLGVNDRGSFALSSSKTELFVRATEGWLGAITNTVNRFLLPKLWAYNNFPTKYCPLLAHGPVSPTDLGILGNYLADLSRAGAPLFPDEDLENDLRDRAHLPRKSDTADIPENV